MIQRMSGGRLSRSRHKVGAYSLPYRRVQSYTIINCCKWSLREEKDGFGLLNDVGADGGSEHCGHRMCLSAGFAIAASDTDGWADRHDDLLVVN